RTDAAVLVHHRIWTHSGSRRRAYSGLGPALIARRGATLPFRQSSAAPVPTGRGRFAAIPYRRLSGHTLRGGVGAATARCHARIAVPDQRAQRDSMAKAHGVGGRGVNWAG